MCEKCKNTYPIGTKVVLAEGYCSDMVIPGHEYKILAHKICVCCKEVMIDIGIRNEINPNSVVTRCPYCAEYEILRDGGIVWCYVKKFIPLNQYEPFLRQQRAEVLFFETQRRKTAKSYKEYPYVFELPISQEKYWEITIPPNKVNEPSKN